MPSARHSRVRHHTFYTARPFLHEKIAIFAPYVTHAKTRPFVMKYILSTILLLCATATLADDYPVNAGKDAVHTHSKRALNAIGLTSPSAGSQSIAVAQSSNKLLYQNLLEKSLTARPGETLTPSFSWTGTWMNTYVYIDFNNDGEFDCTLQDDGTPAEGSDVVSYSYCSGHNSLGEDLTDANVFTPPSFTLPKDIRPGVYRMRYKVDWNCIDAAGNNVEDNDIVTNGGAIADTRLVIRSDQATLAVYTNDSQQAAINATVSFGLPAKIDISGIVSADSIVRSVSVRHGYNLQGESLVHGTPQYVDDTLSFLAVNGDTLTIPATMTDGDIAVRLNLVPTADETSRAVNLVPDAGTTVSGLALGQLRIAGTRTRTFSPKTADLAYQDFTGKAFVPVRTGINAMVTVTGSHTADGITQALSLGQAMLLVDFNRDGIFTPALEAMPAATTLTLPEDLPTGFYKARLYFPSVGSMSDFTVYAHRGTVPLTAETPNGRLTGKTLYSAGGTVLSGKGVPVELAAFRQCSFYAQPLVTGYSAQKAEICTTRPDGTQSHFTVTLSKPSYSFTIPADSVYGEISIKVDFSLSSATPSQSQRQTVLAEEFDGEELDAGLWSTSTRYSAAWNRFIVDDPRTAFVEDGALVCRCFANPGDISGYTGQMVSGAKESRGRFTFNHGYIEARILTTPHSGNFPAFWLMPADQSDGWPSCGEIDIWETINTESRAYNTVHSHWTYDLGNGGNGSNRTCEHSGQWHTFGLLKEAGKLTWYLDGDQVFTYSKSSDESQLSQGQWPFDKAFYIILNQSVGNGSWASAPDPSFTYETKFDWVRVYQTVQEAQDDNNEITGLRQTPQAPVMPPRADNAIYDLSGQRMTQLRPGQFYIQNGKVKLAR